MIETTDSNIDAIHAVITAIRTQNLDEIQSAVNKHGYLSSAWYEESPSCYLCPVMDAAIHTHNPKIVEYFFTGYCDDFAEYDYLIGSAIHTQVPDIVRMTLDRVSTVEHWEFLESAKSQPNYEIREMVEAWAAKHG